MVSQVNLLKNFWRESKMNENKIITKEDMRVAFRCFFAGLLTTSFLILMVFSLINFPDTCTAHNCVNINYVLLMLFGLAFLMASIYFWVSFYQVLTSEDDEL